MRRTRTPAPPTRTTATLVRSAQSAWRGVQTREPSKKAAASVAAHGWGGRSGGGGGGGDGWARPTAVMVYAPITSSPPLPNLADPCWIKRSAEAAAVGSAPTPSASMMRTPTCTEPARA